MKRYQMSSVEKSRSEWKLAASGVGRASLVGLPLCVLVQILLLGQGIVQSFVPAQSSLLTPLQLLHSQGYGSASSFSSSFSFCSNVHGRNRYSRICTTVLRADTMGNNYNNNDNKIGSSNERNLYEILQSSQNATRNELKQAYIQLAKRSHPDALIQGKGRGTNGTLAMVAPTLAMEENIDFNEIAQAWRTLSNPLERKRYDRSLRAQEFTQNVEKIVEQYSRRAAPPVINAIEKLAIPFLRRTTATTVAGFSAAAGQTSNGTSLDFGNIVSKAFEASQNAGRQIDRLELLEKSRELRTRAEKETASANKIRDNLSKLMTKRLQLTIRTPNSKLTSLEAFKILDSFNSLDELTFMDSMMRRYTVSSEIEQLQSIEDEHKLKLNQKRQSEAEVDLKVKALCQAEINAAAAIQAEQRARKALEDAIQLVSSTQYDVASCAKALQQAEDASNKNARDMDKLNIALDRRQERVRIALQNKNDAIKKDKMREAQLKQDLTPGESPSQSELEFDLSNEEIEEITRIAADSQAAKVFLKNLKKEEKFMIAESARLEDKASRLLSRAQKLMDKYEDMGRNEEEAWGRVRDIVEDSLDGKLDGTVALTFKNDDTALYGN